MGVGCSDLRLCSDRAVDLGEHGVESQDAVVSQTQTTTCPNCDKTCTVSASILPSFDFTLTVFTLLAAAPVMLAADYERLAGAHPLAAEHCLVARPARQRSLSSRCPLLQVKRQKVHLAEVVGAQVLHVLEGAH